MVDGPDLPEKVTSLTGAPPIRLAIDAAAGQTTARLGACVAEGGIVCNYGSMTGDDPVMHRGELIYRGVTLGGFGLGRALARRSAAEVRALYADLASQMMAGRLHSPVEKNAERVDLLELVWSSLLRVYEKDAALAWLFGLNPNLGDRRPIDLVRSGRTEDLMRATRAERADSFA